MFGYRLHREYDLKKIWKNLDMNPEIIGLYITSFGVIVAIIEPAITYITQKEKRKLAFKRISEEIQYMPLKNIKGDLKNGLEKKYADKLVSSHFILVAKIKNNGDLSIRNYDIINPIKISFPEKIIECNIIEENPDNIDVHLTRNHEENSVECNFELLNPGDYFTLKFISSEKLSIPTITARIDSLSRVSTSKFEADYSSLNPIHRNLKRFLHMIKEVNLSRPISTFTVPGIIILIGSLFMGSQALRTFSMGGGLYFGQTMLIILLTFIGAFMVLIGLLLHSISFYRKSRSKNKNH